MSDHSIDILMITHNRPEYARMALGRLLESCGEDMRVWVWHNGNHEPTLDVVREFTGHPRLHRFHHSAVNAKLREPTNWVWSEASGPYFAKVDDDCLVSDGWAQELRATLEGEERLGVVACWHFQEQDYDPRLAEPKLRTLANGRRIMQSLWVQGSGIMMKRRCIEEHGLIPGHYVGFTPYCRMLAVNGWRLGWAVPLVLIDHMDDPRSPNSRFKTEEDFERNPPLGADFGGVRSLAEWRERVKWLARETLEAPLDPRVYHGWRSLRRRAADRIRRALDIAPPWRVAARKANGQG